jgi:hypothetical protein
MAKENNFFTQNIDRYGENFLDYINARAIQNASINIFRGIAKGKINLDKYGHYFTFNQFLEPCIESARAKYLLYSVSYRGVECLIRSGISSADVVSVLDYHKRCFEAYSIILQELNNIKVDKDVSHLYIMANKLSQYRFNI